MKLQFKTPAKKCNSTYDKFSHARLKPSVFHNIHQNFPLIILAILSLKKLDRALNSPQNLTKPHRKLAPIPLYQLSSELSNFRPTHSLSNIPHPTVLFLIGGIIHILANICLPFKKILFPLLNFQFFICIFLKT